MTRPEHEEEARTGGRASRSHVVAGVLTAVALGALFLGAASLREVRQESYGDVLVAFSILATGCLCTAAVLWARVAGGR